MGPRDLPDNLRDEIRRRAKGRCEYCQTSERVSGTRCEVDHITPRSLGGAAESANLCLACVACNGHKATRTSAADPQTSATVPLFHPRRDRWDDHFAWSAEGTEIVGRTPQGRATALALQMNDSLIVAARALWVSIGVHPPQPHQT